LTHFLIENLLTEHPPLLDLNRYVYLIQESADIDAVINEKWANRQIRTSPYILKRGKTYSIVVEGKVYMDTPPSSLEALLSLLCVYYVFNIQWCPNVRSVFLFFQSQLSEKLDERTLSCKNLGVFMNNFHAKEKLQKS
jgi:hypothetical protein